MPSKHLNLTGQTFGRLKVLREVDGVRGPGGSMVRRWLCQCQCGTRKVIRQNSLTSGVTVSCGCYQKERLREVVMPLSLKHGGAIKVDGKQSREYRIWCYMKRRCYNTRSIVYQYYGARGITVCERWRQSFQHFLDDMGSCPPGCSIDRINNDLGYSPDNCRWANNEQQANNMRKNALLEFRGESLTISQWSRRTGIRAGVIWKRLRRGWPIERALTEPLHLDTHHSRMIVWHNERRSLAEWSRRSGIAAWTISDRLERGWSIERALTESVRHC